MRKEREMREEKEERQKSIIFYVHGVKIPRQHRDGKFINFRHTEQI
jgi:hypothetical protein